MFAFFHGQDISEVEDGLFPVRILGVWSSGEADRLVACLEVNIKPGNDRVNEVVALHS